MNDPESPCHIVIGSPALSMVCCLCFQHVNFTFYNTTLNSNSHNCTDSNCSWNGFGAFYYHRDSTLMSTTSLWSWPNQTRSTRPSRLALILNISLQSLYLWLLRLYYYESKWSDTLEICFIFDCQSWRIRVSAEVDGEETTSTLTPWWCTARTTPILPSSAALLTRSRRPSNRA